jgi:hypothetical protein
MSPGTMQGGGGLTIRRTSGGGGLQIASRLMTRFGGLRLDHVDVGGALMPSRRAKVEGVVKSHQASLAIWPDV